MKEKDRNDELSEQPAAPEGKDNLPGYPVYPASDDIYSKFNEEKNINPEDISQNKDAEINKDDEASDMDVPGSELDDDQESIGSEDEENNYYSIGGDDHIDLDEDDTDKS